MDFIAAVKCLQGKPSQTPKGVNENARNRWDDFTVAHVLNTPQIHWSGLLLPWHRHFVWTLEQTLRNECGYSGYMPYWDWSKYLDGPWAKDPMFDGSETSLGGNGTGPNHCIEDGPLVDFVVNIPPPDNTSSIQPNPRCIKRNFEAGLMQAYMTYPAIIDLVTNSSGKLIALLSCVLQSVLSRYHNRHHRVSRKDGITQRIPSYSTLCK